MPEIQLEIRPGEFIPFEIKGDKPTYPEMLQAERLIKQMDKPVSPLASRDETPIDRETGIQESKLRRQLARAETGGEEEAVLSKYGFREGDYIRDNRGNLALTPRGAALIGVDTDKPIAIDESGFSLMDLQDFVGAAGEEIVGGVAGALAGQAAIPVPLLGAVIGAGLGTGAGKAVEETTEALQGVQRQELGDIGGDILTEAAIGAAGEGIFGLVARGFGGIAGRGRVGAKLTPQAQQEVAEAIGSNYKPSISAMGGPSLIGRQQAMSEKALGTSKRLRDNHDQIMEDLAKLRSYGAEGGMDIDRTAAVLTNAVKSGDTALLQAEKNATNNLIKHMDDIAVQMGKAANKDTALNTDIQGAFVNAFKAFDDEVQKKYANIENLTNSAIGDAALFNTRGLKENAKVELDRLTAAGSGNLGKSRQAVEELMKLPDDASFTQIYKARKALNDTWMGNYGSDSVKLMKDKFLDKLDAFISPQAVENAFRRKTFRDMMESGAATAEDKALMKTVAKEIPKVRDFFSKGMDSFEKVSGAASLKSLNNAVKGGKELNPQGAYNRLIRNDNPKLLQDAKSVLERNLGEGAFEDIRNRAAGEWLRKAMRESGSTLDSTRKFSGSKFKEKLEALGTTSDELFGSQAKEVKKLADQLDSLSLTRIDQSVIDDFVASGADEAGVNLLRNVRDIMKEKADFDAVQVARKLRSGNITSSEAADLLASPSMRGDDITQLGKFFKDKPVERAELQSYYMQSLIGDFEDTFLTDKKAFKLLSKRIEQAKKSGKIDALFDPEDAKAIGLFGQNMKVLGVSAEGGDLVAANIAASPLENLGTLARLSVVGRVLSTGPFYTTFMKKYGPQAATQKTKSGKMRVFLETLNDVLGAAARQQTARGIAGVTSSLGSEAERFAEGLSEQMESRVPAAPQITRTTIPVPEVAPVDTPSLPQSSSIREQAKQNPAVAATLLGGLGNMGLL
jgi:hypothetical protein